MFAGHAKTLDQFTYYDSDINDVMFECLGKSSIQGVSGRRFFPDGRDPDGVVMIERSQGRAFSFNMSVGVCFPLDVSHSVSLIISLFTCLVLSLFSLYVCLSFCQHMDHGSFLKMYVCLSPSKSGKLDMLTVYL